MAQPRGLQINSPQSKYSTLNPLLAQALTAQTVPFSGVAPFTGAYTALLAETATNEVGGCDVSVPANITGSAQGPFNVGVGSGFTISINGGAPITALINSGDVFIIGGSGRVTTATLAARINTAVAGSGVTASDFNGYLRIVGNPPSTSGAAASITVTSGVVTVSGLTGVVSSMIGGTITVTGANSPINNGVFTIEQTPTSSTVVINNLEAVTDGNNGSLNWFIVSPSGVANTFTLTDSTPGFLTAVGLSSPSMTVTGVDAGTPGLLTISPSLNGGYTPYRLVDGEPAVTQVTSSLHVGNINYVPDFNPGQPIYGRVTSPVTGTVNISTFTSGPVRPQVVSAKLNPATLGGGDTIVVSATIPGYGPIFTGSIGFGSSPTTASAVVTLINTAWWATSTQNAGRAFLACGSGPYSIPSSASFTIVLNGNAPIVISIPVTAITPTLLSNTINTAIATAGQSAQGTSSVQTNGLGLQYVQINSLLTAGTGSTIQISGSIDVLDRIGLAPGLYTGSNICALYGQDEIAVFCPSRAPGAAITITGPAPTMVKLGFGSVTSVGAFSQPGEEGYVHTATNLQVLLPEVMPFGDIPINHGDYVQQFTAPALPGFIDPTLGQANQGLAALLGPSGQLPPGLLPKILSFLELDQIALGSHIANTATNLQLARELIASNSDLGRVLIQDVPNAGTAPGGGRVRIYMAGSGGGNADKYTTINASYNNTTNLWTNDNATYVSYLIHETNGKTVYSSFPASTLGTTWNDTAWKQTARVGKDPSVSTDIGLVNIGSGYTSGGTTATSFSSTTPDMLIPRIEISPPTPSSSAFGQLSLIWETVDTVNGGIGTRLYSQNTTTLSQIFLTINARWDGTNWNKDTVGTGAVALVMDVFGPTLGQVQFLGTTSDTPWSSWQRTGVTVDAANGVGAVDVPGQLTVGDSMLGSVANALLPRLSLPVANPSTVVRTLISRSVFSGAALRTYAVPVSGGLTAFEITINCSWQSDNAHWASDNTSLPAAKYGLGYLSGAGTSAQQFVKGATASTWTDSGWDPAEVFFSSTGGANGISVFSFGNTGSGTGCSFVNLFSTNITLGQGTALTGTPGGVLTITGSNVGGGHLEIHNVGSGALHPGGGCLYNDNIIKAWAQDLQPEGTPPGYNFASNTDTYSGTPPNTVAHYPLLRSMADTNYAVLNSVIILQGEGTIVPVFLSLHNQAVNFIEFAAYGSTGNRVDITAETGLAHPYYTITFAIVGLD